ncbi:hypothetical protein J6590_088588 [Homalodisca vitripennis]|nr:hypothetical protein J6590_088588 [Homalodisca vitripennis]
MFPSHMQQPLEKRRRIIIRKKASIELPNAELQCKAGTSTSSSSIALPVEQDNSQSPSNPATQELTAQQTPVKRIRSRLPSPSKVHLRRKVKVLQQRLNRRDCKIRVSPRVTGK